MAWHECVNGEMTSSFPASEKRISALLKTTCKEDADDDVKLVEVNLRKVERGYLTIPNNADVVSFLLSNGHVSEPLAAPDQITLKVLFDRYLAACRLAVWKNPRSAQ